MLKYIHIPSISIHTFPDWIQGWWKFLISWTRVAHCCTCSLGYPYAPCMVYLPTKLGDFVRANVGKYSSTMVRIWDKSIGGTPAWSVTFSHQGLNCEKQLWYTTWNQKKTREVAWHEAGLDNQIPCFSPIFPWLFPCLSGSPRNHQGHQCPLTCFNPGTVQGHLR